MPILFVVITLLGALVITLFSGLKRVSQKNAVIVERLGKYNRTLRAGLHVVIPFIERCSEEVDLKEQARDVPPQKCITRDNIQLSVDGVLYLQIIDPVKAVYGISNCFTAAEILAKTTMRSEIGKLDLDQTFEERQMINTAVCAVLDKAAEPWGLKVLRYEIQSITPPDSITGAMEEQMRAEREKRAKIAKSEGDRQARINNAEGEKQELMAKSEGEKIRKINEATGKAEEIRLVAEATAQGIAKIAEAISMTEGGKDAVNLKLAEQYITEFGKVANASNTMILPTNMADIAGMLKVATEIIRKN